MAPQKPVRVTPTQRPGPVDDIDVMFGLLPTIASYWAAVLFLLHILEQLTGKKIQLPSRVALVAGLAVPTVAMRDSTRMREAMALNGLMRETAAALDSTRELLADASREAVARDARQAAQANRLYAVAKFTLAGAIATLVVAIIALAS